MIVNEEILKRVEEKEKVKRYIRRCLVAKICPKCGEELSYKYHDDGGETYKCNSCNFKHNT